MIEIKDISFSYGSKSIIENINVDVQRGECVAVLGNNGAGKSTFITCLNKIRNPKRQCLFWRNVITPWKNREKPWKTWKEPDL